MPGKVLVVDDERDIVELVTYNLEREGFTVIPAYDGETALAEARMHTPDLILLDLMLPGIQGMEVCKLIRNDPSLNSIPIIMITAKSDEIDRVLGLEMGADDYITKPFSVRELVARIHSVVRRARRPADDAGRRVFSYLELLIDFDRHIVSIGGERINLSPTEFKLLAYLVRHPGRVYTRSHLLDHVWGDETFVEERTVDVHIRRLRARLEKDPAQPRYLLTVRGFGYKFADIP
jgi:two-component system, OmpR family, alkaline phosphatase synthesis response regulator PhoP